ncbi:hypothetical protein PG984_014771 [Apiospora sp. TS-2023a]
MGTGDRTAPYPMGRSPLAGPTTTTGPTKPVIPAYPNPQTTERHAQNPAAPQPSSFQPHVTQQLDNPFREPVNPQTPVSGLSQSSSPVASVHRASITREPIPTAPVAQAPILQTEQSGQTAGPPFVAPSTTAPARGASTSPIPESIFRARNDNPFLQRTERIFKDPPNKRFAGIGLVIKPYETLEASFEGPPAPPLVALGQPAAINLPTTRVLPTEVRTVPAARPEPNGGIGPKLMQEQGWGSGNRMVANPQGRPGIMTAKTDTETTGTSAVSSAPFATSKNRDLRRPINFIKSAVRLETVRRN